MILCTIERKYCHIHHSRFTGCKIFLISDFHDREWLQAHNCFFAAINDDITRVRVGDHTRRHKLRDYIFICNTLMHAAISDYNVMD